MKHLRKFRDEEFFFKENKKGSKVFFLKKENSIISVLATKIDNEEIYLNNIEPSEITETLIKKIIEFYKDSNTQKIWVKSNKKLASFFMKLGFKIKRKDFVDLDDLSNWMYIELK